MSTSYYRLTEPFTSIKMEEGPGHDRVKLWEHGALAGELVLTKGWGKRVCLLFALHEEDNECPLRTHWGGQDRGAVVTVNDKAMPNEACVISEYGEPLTVQQVKERDGTRRSDSWPTELFGYEAPKPTP